MILKEYLERLHDRNLHILVDQNENKLMFFAKYDRDHDLELYFSKYILDCEITNIIEGARSWVFGGVPITMIQLKLENKIVRELPN